MKIQCGWAKKEGRSGYGSDGPWCGVELEIDDALAADSVKLREQIKRLHSVCYQAVEDELRLHEPPKAREPGDDDAEADDVRPGDPAYERSGRSSHVDDRGSFNEFEDDAGYPNPGRGDYDNPPQRGRGDRRDSRPPPRRNDRPAPSRRDDRRGGGGQRTYAPPRNAKTFCGWFMSLNDLGDEGKDVQKEVYKILRAWDLPTAVKELNDDDAVAVYNEIMGAGSRRGGGDWGGNGNGRSNGDGGRR
jgi:hypothetical protein